MKAKIIFLTCFIFLVFAACKHQPNEIKKDCLTEMLEKNDLNPYNGEEISGCVFFLVQHEWKGNDYFVLSNPCMDMFVTAVDCDGNPVEDANFWSEATSKGIVGIGK
jgi:hypothetical protein